MMFGGSGYYSSIWVPEDSMLVSESCQSESISVSDSPIPKLILTELHDHLAYLVLR